MWRLLSTLVVLPCVLFAACDSGGREQTPTAGTATAVVTAIQSPSPAPPSATPPAIVTPTVTPDGTQPLGLPLDPDQPVGLVDYRDADRPIRWGAGPGALTYSRDVQPADDPLAANAGGWNCRVHVAFEGRPAVDWYIPVGTPVRATISGTATLYVITTTNAFDYYGVSRAPYTGYPSGEAAVSPFPGPGGGKGVYLEIRNNGFVTESAHLALDRTAAVVPGAAFLLGFEPGDALLDRFEPMRGYLDATPIATWPVERGDIVGYSGDSGYSEAPHLHYTVRRTDGGLLCPTTEAGFEDGGWLAQ